MKKKLLLIICALCVSLGLKAQEQEVISVYQNETEAPIQIAISNITKITFENEGMNVTVNNSNEPHFFELSGIDKITFGLGIVGLESITYDSNEKLDIYPNPTENNLFIETEHKIEEIVIYDVYGRVSTVYRLQSTDFVHSIDVADLNAGIYFVKVVTDNNEIVKRFVKK